MNERRREPRRRVLRTGKIVHNALSSVYDCRIADQTERGARLKIDNSWAVPGYFEFMDTARGKARRPASVVWRSADELGIEFDDAA